VRGVGLFDFLRGKPEEDPILGGRSAEPTGLEVTPVEGPPAWTSSSTTRVDAAVSQSGGALMDPAELMRTLQEAGGDPDRIVAELRERFPGAHIDIQQSTIDGDSHPELARAMQAGFGGEAMPAPADPIAQIERLAELHRSGALTDAEFAAAKAKLLGS
jgi:hypothetical protein